MARPSMRPSRCLTASRSTGPSGLRQALLRYSPQFVRMVTEKMMTYALGRGVEYSDMPVVRSIVRDAAKNNNRFSAIVLGIVKSAPFQMRVKVEKKAGQEPDTCSSRRSTFLAARFCAAPA